MPSARLLMLRCWGVVMLVGLFLSHPAHIKATTYQSCVEGSPCIVGEFVYADDATPIATASCQLTSYLPSGSPFLNALSLSGTADGWYGFGFTPTATYSAGTYITQLCCDTVENNICIDKSFTITLTGPTPAPGLTGSDVSNAVWNASTSSYTNSGSFGSQLGNLVNNTLSAGDIWGYANRSLTSITNIISGLWGANTTDYQAPGTFGDKITTTTNLSAEQVWEYNNRSLTDAGNIATSVWDNSSRSLTSFGSLVSDIWSRPNRTLDPSAATPLDLSAIEREIKASRDLIEKLVAIPNQSSLTPDESIDYAARLEAKLKETKEYISQIATNMDSVSIKVGLITLKWDELSETDRISELQEAIRLLGTDEASNPTTIIGQLKWLSEAWDKPITNELYTDTVSLRDDLGNFLTTFQASTSNSNQLADLGALFSRFTSLKADVGDISQAGNVPSLYGMYRSLKDLAAGFDRINQAIDAAGTNWPALSPADQLKTIEAIAIDLTKINQLPTLRELLSPIEASSTYLESLSAAVNINRAVLSASGKEPVIVTWIDSDATRYRTFVHNPSKRNSKSAAVKFFLPVELTLEHITKTPADFTLNYDPQTNALQATATIALDPNQSRLFDITTTNLWQIRPEDITTLRNQATELVKPLENTERYTEAATIKSNIDVALDAVIALRDAATTPTTKIQAYRQAQTLLTEIDGLMTRLKQLVTDHQSGRSLMGFIGGAQAIAVWGIIVIFIAGFIFLSMYMRTLYTSTINQPAMITPESLPLIGPPAPALIAPAPLNFNLPFQFSHLPILTDRRFSLSLTILSALLLTLMVSRQVNPTIRPPQQPTNQAVIPNISQLEPSPLASPKPTAEAGLTDPEPTLIIATSSSLLISPPDMDMKVAVRQDPQSTSKAVAQITGDESATQIDALGKWIKVELSTREPIIVGWIHQDLAIIIPEN